MIAIPFHLLLLIALSVIALKSRAAIRSERGIFCEFGEPNSLGSLVLLYPLGPIFVIGGIYFLPTLLGYLLSIACFVPALVVATRISRRLECAGTDRVKGANEAVSSVITGAIVGLIYTGFFMAIGVAARFIVQVA